MTTTSTLAGASGLRARKFTGRFSGDLPRHWLGGTALATHLANGVNLLFPAGERFFVRSVRRYLDRLENDPELTAAVRAFGQQEGLHAAAHEKLFAELEGQGLSIRPFLHVYEAIAYGFIEKVAPAELSLATTAACEHFTAILAENFLKDDLGQLMPETMRQLLGWHAAEEIEHRAVAFEVLQRVNPGYGLRVAGMAMGAACLAGFWIAATVTLMAQEESPLRSAAAGRQAVGERNPFGHRVFGRGIRDYLRRDFHPSQATHLDDIAAAYLARAGLAPRGDAGAVRAAR